MNKYFKFFLIDLFIQGKQRMRLLTSTKDVPKAVQKVETKPKGKDLF
jgi:hypothetical protein